MASTPRSLAPNIVNASLDTLEDLDHLIELEEQIIKNSQNRILQLKTRRNVLSPICRIPQELLGEILVALARLCADEYQYQPIERVQMWYQPQVVGIASPSRIWVDLTESGEKSPRDFDGVVG